jgi:hypothetical protein
VQLLAHLTDADIRRYVAGNLNPETERHVRICVCCALRLGVAAVQAVWWERRGPLGRLMRVDNSQAVDELLAEIARNSDVTLPDPSQAPIGHRRDLLSTSSSRALRSTRTMALARAVVLL